MSWLHHLFLPRESNNQRAKILHPSALGLIIGIFTLTQLLIGHVSHSYPYILGYASQIAPEEVIHLTNEQRQAHGLTPVKLDGQLTQAALLKASDMFARDYWAHVSPQGTQPWYFVTKAGYAYRYAGENLARDFSDPASIVKAWMDSPTHKENLLSSRYQDIGVAVIDGRLEGRDTTLVVQMFGTRLSASSAVTATAFAVQAKEAPVNPTPIPLEPTSVPVVANTRTQASVPISLDTGPTVSPFSLTKFISLSLLLIVALVLLVDIVLTHKRGIVRWTSRSPAHLIFVSVLIVAALSIWQGQIL